jgi:anti-anti-sigma factor
MAVPKPREPAFDLREERRGEVLVLRVRGRLDLSAGEAVERRVASAAGRLALRLDEVTYLSSSGVAALVKLATGARPVALCCPAECVRDVLSLAGVDRIVAIHADEEGALRGP